MPPLQQQMLQFVDREDEMRIFERMLDDSETWPPILVVVGDGGMGKSSLMLRMRHECSARKLPTARVVWTDLHNHDHLATMRIIRDDLGASQFSEFTKLVNFFTDPHCRLEVVVTAGGSISVGEGMDNSGKVGMMAGVVLNENAIVIKDLMLTDARTDLAIHEGDRIARLTDKFVEELNAVAATSRIVIFLDAIEKASEATRRWILDGLVMAVREGRLSNILFVICGRNRLTYGEELKSLIDERQLAPLARIHIEQYVRQFDLSLTSEEFAVLVTTLEATTDGTPLKLESAVRRLKQLIAEKRQSKP